MLAFYCRFVDLRLSATRIRRYDGSTSSASARRSSTSKRMPLVCSFSISLRVATLTPGSRRELRLGKTELVSEFPNTQPERHWCREHG